MSLSSSRSTAVAALGTYLAWTGATWFFEGRIQTLLRPDASADRIAYALGVNLLPGVVGALWLLRRFSRHGDPHAAARCGFGPPARTMAAAVAGLALGLAAHLGQGAPSTHPAVVANAFAQVFVVWVAEIMVCWALAGAAIAPRAQRPTRPAAQLTP